MSNGEAVLILACQFLIFWIMLLTRSGRAYLGDCWDAIKSVILAVAHLGRRRSPERTPDWAAAAEEVGFFDPLPDPKVRHADLWTPAERDAFDIDAIGKFIAETDDELDWEIQRQKRERNRAAWEEFQRRADERQARMRELSRARDSASEREIRRAGAQLIATESAESAG